MASLKDGLSTGLRWGVMYGVVCSMVGIASVVGSGSASLEPYHLTPFGMVALYMGLGVLGGTVFGLMMPLGRTLVGAVLLGVLVALPVAFAMTAVVSPGLGPTSGEFLWIWGGVSLLGPIGGAGLWVINNRR